MATLTEPMLLNAGFHPTLAGWARAVHLAGRDLEDDPVVDYVEGLAGMFLPDSLLELVTLQLFVPSTLDSLLVEAQAAQDELQGATRRYPFPEQEAYAIRGLRDYLGLDLPLETITLQSTTEAVNGCLRIDGQPVVVEYPVAERIVSIVRTLDLNHQMVYRCSDGNERAIGCDLVIATLA